MCFVGAPFQPWPTSVFSAQADRAGLEHTSQADEGKGMRQRLLNTCYMPGPGLGPFTKCHLLGAS